MTRKNENQNKFLVHQQLKVQQQGKAAEISKHGA